MTQVEELVSLYYGSIGMSPLPGFKKRSIDAVTELIDHGVQVAKIQGAIEYYVENFEIYSDRPYVTLNTVFSTEDIQEILKCNTINKDNLIDSARFYYHKRLRILPKPPKMIIDDKGNHTTIIEPFFMEMIKTFTYEYLLDYFYTVHCVDELSRKEKRDMAALKYVVNTYRDSSIKVNWLDLILYMIDVSRQIIIDADMRPMVSIFHIQDYELQSLDLLEDKINYERVNGVDKIVPRKTMDSGDGWTK